MDTSTQANVRDPKSRLLLVLRPYGSFLRSVPRPCAGAPAERVRLGFHWQSNGGGQPGLLTGRWQQS